MLDPLSKESRDMPIKERFVLATSFRDVSLPSERVEPAISRLSALEFEVQRFVQYAKDGIGTCPIASRSEHTLCVYKTRNLWIRGPMLGPLCKEGHGMREEGSVLTSLLRDVNSPSAWLEPAIFGLEVERFLHEAKRAVTFSQESIIQWHICSKGELAFCVFRTPNPSIAGQTTCPSGLDGRGVPT